MGQDGEDGQGRSLTPEEQYAEDLKSSRHFEASLVWRELVAIAIVVAVVVVRQLWFL